MANKPVSITLGVSVLLILHTTALMTTTQQSTTSQAPAVMFFGDSIVDPGNNNGIETLVKCNFPPYGKDFIGHNPTGRFSNGKIPSDFIASRLGIKDLVPAYLSKDLDDQELLTGVSFASGGTGYDPLTSTLVSTISLSDQLKLFKEYQTKLKSIAGESKAESIISKSTYFVITGTDDLANNYFVLPLRRSEYDLPSYVRFLAQNASNFVKELYDLGARKIGLIGAPPLGCVPSQRTIAGGVNRDCVPLYNEAAVLLNVELSKHMRKLNETHDDTKIVYIDMYTTLLDLILRPFAYGFEESSKACCGTGTFEVTLTCNSLTTSTCEDASKYVFWDSYHPTERAYEILIDQLFQQYGSALT